MRLAKTFVPAFLSLLLTSPARGQQAATTVQRDPQAIGLVQQTFAAMGSAQALLLQDSLGSGQATIYKPDGTSVTFPIPRLIGQVGLLPVPRSSGGTSIRLLLSLVLGSPPSSASFRR